jgi:hypothetical protein
MRLNRADSLTSAVSRRRVQTFKAPRGAWHDTRDRWAERRSAVFASLCADVAG